MLQVKALLTWVCGRQTNVLAYMHTHTHTHFSYNNFRKPGACSQPAIGAHLVLKKLTQNLPAFKPGTSTLNTQSLNHCFLDCSLS